MVQEVKRMLEKLTGIGRPDAANISVRARRPHAFHFHDDGATPNNPRFAMVLYRSPAALPASSDPAAIFEELFSAHGWADSWRDGIYDFLHFHTHTHEVLGIARGHAKVQFGGAHGRRLDVRAGDVVILPAGTGHKRLAKSRDLLVVGAYPSGGRYDQPRPKDIPHAQAVAAIAKVGAPKQDPVYGLDGPLISLWRRSNPQ